MKRKALAICAGIDPRRHDLLAQRDQLPYPKKMPHEGYGIDEAFELSLMLAFADEGGIDLKDARDGATSCVSQFIPGRLNARQHPDMTIHPLNLPVSAGEFWAVICHVRVKGGSEVFPNGFNFHFSARLCDVEAHAAGMMAEYYADCDLVRIVMVNASRIADQVRRRAYDLGIPEGKDFSHIWKGSTYPEWARDFDPTKAAGAN